jgi:hypothetical protein
LKFSLDWPIFFINIWNCSVDILQSTSCINYSLQNSLQWFDGTDNTCGKWYSKPQSTPKNETTNYVNDYKGNTCSMFDLTTEYQQPIPFRFLGGAQGKSPISFWIRTWIPTKFYWSLASGLVLFVRNALVSTSCCLGHAVNLRLFIY